MRSLFILTVCLLLAHVPSSLAEDICSGSDKWPAPSDAQELKMYEKDFNLDQAMKSVTFLEKDVVKIIREHEHKSYSILDYEGFYIGYPNNITFVKGTLLKQDALIARNKFEIEKLKLKDGNSTKKEVSKAEQAYLKAQKRFCEFLRQAEYVD